MSKLSLSNLSSFSGERHKSKRLGRGKGSGHGGTSTKGHKGQRARSGFGLLRGFEGGQMPLVRLLPKFGFTNARFKTKYNIINLSDLNKFDSEVNPSVLYEAGFISKGALVKILGEGKLNKSLKVSAHHFSEKASKIIKEQGGSIDKIVILTHADNMRALKEAKKKNKQTGKTDS